MRHLSVLRRSARILALAVALPVLPALAKTPAMPMPTAADMSDEERLVIDVDINRKGVEAKRTLPVPNSAKKLFARYTKIADAMAPLTIHRGGDGKKTAWAVGKNAKNSTLVFLNMNLCEETTEVVFRISDKDLRPMTPTYRRVLSKDGGKHWTTLAYEPPHHSTTGCPPYMREPYTIKVPGHCCQVVIVRLK